MNNEAGILVAAGRSARMGFDKIWAPLGGSPVLQYGLLALARAGLDEVVLVLPEGQLERGRALLRGLKISGKVCAGGPRRSDSVAAGYRHLSLSQWVVVHDAARPLAGTELVRQALAAALVTGAAVPVVEIADTVKRVWGDQVVETLDRALLRLAQTPQAFEYALLGRCLAEIGEDVTDEASLVERSGVKVRIFPGDVANLKITTPRDLALAEALLAGR